MLASSTTGIPPSPFTEHVAGRQRCLVAHPINPPFVTPLVEICPAPWTDAAVVDRAHALMIAVGQAPIRMRREVQGFIANRMQAALIGAALRMVRDGVASAEDVDIAIRDGIGLRWSFIGPLETIDLNAPGGISDYLRRYGPLYQAIEREHAEGALDWTDEELLRKLDEERRRRLPHGRSGRAQRLARPAADGACRAKAPRGGRDRRMTGRKTMANKVIISCAVTGSIHTPTMTPHLPITAQEIAQSAIGAAEAGAAIVHLHARDPEDRPADAGSGALHGVPAGDQAERRCGGQHHHRRRPRHVARGAARRPRAAPGPRCARSTWAR